MKESRPLLASVALPAPLHQSPSSRLKDTAPESYYLLVTLLTVFWLISLRFVFKTLFTYRTVKSTAASKIRSAAQGAVSLKGTQSSALKIPELSPLTYTPCTWYDYRIQKRTTDIQNRLQWITIYQVASTTPFYLRDETGECLVFPEQAMVNSETVFLKYWTDGHPWAQPEPANKPLPPWLDFLWHFVNIFTLGLLYNMLRNRPYRHIETIMKPNDPITANGFYRSFYSADQTAFMALFSPIKEAHPNAEWTIPPKIQQTIHTLSAFPQDENAPFLLSNTTEGRLMRVQWQTLFVWLSVNLFLLMVLGLMIAVY